MKRTPCLPAPEPDRDDRNNRGRERIAAGVTEVPSRGRPSPFKNLLAGLLLEGSCRQTPLLRRGSHSQPNSARRSLVRQWRWLSSGMSNAPTPSRVRRDRRVMALRSSSYEATATEFFCVAIERVRWCAQFFEHCQVLIGLSGSPTDHSTASHFKHFRTQTLSTTPLRRAVG